MGLGIHKERHLTVYSAPLRGMDDHNWNDNTWICEHLRQLANKIEETDIDIYSMGIEMNHQYNAPYLVIKGWERKNDSFNVPKLKNNEK